MSLLLVKDTSNNKLKELEVDASGLLKVQLPDVSGLALESSLSSLNGKVVTCDTANMSGNVACTHAALPLPAGAATSAEQTLQTGHLNTLAGAVSAGVVQVSSPAVSSSTTQMFGSGGAAEVITSGNYSTGTSVDCNGFNKICIFGNTDNLSDTSIDVKVSDDNVNFFELDSQYINIDYISGDFGIIMDMPARYVMLYRSNTSGSTENIKAFLSGK